MVKLLGYFIFIVALIRITRGSRAPIIFKVISATVDSFSSLFYGYLFSFLLHFITRLEFC